MLIRFGMAGVKRFEDLDCWKLATELADLIDAMTASGPALNDADLRRQLRKAGTKAPAQIAEGFGRYLPGDFANFLRMARASLCESQTHLDRGARRKYWTPEQVSRVRTLANRAIGATTNLMLDRLRAAETRRQPAATRRKPKLRAPNTPGTTAPESDST
jgi:four helix bundle protein